MKAVQLFCALILTVALSTIVTDAGAGIQDGTVSYTMYLGDQSSCTGDDECLRTCKDQAKNPDAVVKAKFMKFTGNLRKYCCCYGAATNACCQFANSGLDCIPS